MWEGFILAGGINQAAHIGLPHVFSFQFFFGGRGGGPVESSDVVWMLSGLRIMPARTCHVSYSLNSLKGAI